MWHKILSIIQIVVAILLILSILLQQRGTTLGGAFGGESGFYRSRRGPEKFLYILTIVLGIVFVALAVVNFVFPS